MTWKCLVVRFLLPLCVLGMLAPSPASGQDLLVGSWSTHSVRRYDSTTGEFIGNFVFPSSGGLTTPNGLDLGPDGNLYVSSADTNQVLRYDGRTGAFIDVFASAGLVHPSYLEFRDDGFLYVCSGFTDQVIRYDAETGASGGVFASGGGMDFPAGLTWHDGLLYVAGFSGGGGVFRYDAVTGDFVDVFTTDPVGPLYLRFGDDGNLYVCDYHQDSIRIYQAGTGDLLDVWTNAFLSGPVGQLIGPGGSLIVASWNNHRVLKLDARTGALLGVFLSRAGLALPNDLLILPPVACPADFDGDGAVGAVDLATLLGAWGPCAGCPADLNSDGVVGPFDLANLLGAWGACL